MKVILLEDVKGQGKKNQLVAVNDGYARNYLIPKKLAIEANSVNLNTFEQKKASELKQKEIERQKAIAFRDKMNGITIKIKVKCGESGKLFGSVTSKEIAEALNDMGHIVDKKMVMLKEPIKSIGRAMVEVKLYHDIIARVNIVIEA